MPATNELVLSGLGKAGHRTPVCRFDFVPQATTLDRPVPGQIMLDTGRNVVLGDDGAVLDHHQLLAASPSTAHSAASLVLEHAAHIAALAQTGGEFTIVLHQNPDLDAVTAAAVTARLLHGGVAALPRATRVVVDYVRQCDNAAYANSDVAASMAMIVSTYFQRIAAAICDECVAAYNAANPTTPVAGHWQLPAAEKARLQWLMDQTIAHTGTRLILDLLDADVDPLATNGALPLKTLPKRWQASLQEARDAMADDVTLYTREKSTWRMVSLALPAREGNGRMAVQFAVSRNTRSAFFPYLYAEAIQGGIIYKDTVDCTKVEHFPGARVVIAVKPDQNVTLATKAAALHAAELEKRVRLGLVTTPANGEPLFFKTVSNGTLLISHGSGNDQGMLALTAEEVMAAIAPPSEFLQESVAPSGGIR